MKSCVNKLLLMKIAHILIKKIFKKNKGLLIKKKKTIN